MQLTARPALPLLLGALLLFGAGTVLAQRFPRELKDIKLYGKGEVIRFIFSQPYEGTPVAEFRPGYFSLNFSGTGSSKPVRSLVPREASLIKGIKVVENRYSTTVAFTLKDPKLSLQDRLDFASKDNVLRVRLHPSGGPAAKAGAAVARQSQDKQLLKEMGTMIADMPDSAAAPGQPKAAAAAAATPLPALGALAGGDFWAPMVTMVVALGLIILGLYGVLFLYNRYFARRLGRLTGGHSMKQLASFHIGPRQRIVVLEINGEVIACGVTPGQITYLTHLGAKGAELRKAAAQAAAAAQGPGGSAAEASAPAVPGAGLEAPRGDPVHQFAEVLKQKVRSLKRIN